MGKTACKMSKDEIRKMSKKQVEFQCKKCGVTTNKEKKLCKPVKL